MTAKLPSIPRVPQRLPRFYAQQQRVEDAKKLEAILREVDEVENEAGMPRRRSADGHNRDRAAYPHRRANRWWWRPGTDPEAALIRKEARSERRR